MNDTKDIQLHRAILNELGYNLDSNSVILDFGCGEGKRVYEYRNAGFNSFGVDINLNHANDLLRLIHATNGYRIPFNDETFDFVFSEQVFEHVQDYASALSEIWRILKPGGFSLHLFPSKYIPIEPHIFVPFGGIFQGYAWLLLWAFLGIRNSFQKGLTYRDVAARNLDYLRNNTCYMPKSEIQRHILAHYGNVTFTEKYLIKHSYARARYIYPIVKIFPFVASLYSSFYYRLIFFEKKTG